MASYAMEDVELIRRLSGVTYEEAVSLLDYHNGEVALVLVDLEKSGRLKGNSAAGNAGKKETTVSDSKGGSKAMNLIQKLYRTRIKVHKGDTVIVNLSVLYMVLAVILFSPHLALVSLALGLILGYRISIDKNDEAFREDKVENLVRNAADNVKQAVSDISREIGHAVEKQNREKKPVREEAKAAETPKAREEMKAEAKAEVKTEAKAEVRAEKPMNTRMPDLNADIVRDLNRHENNHNVPVMQVPVRAESTDGHVEVVGESGGYYTATVG